MKCPCKECFHRTITCHGFCEGYKAWREWRDEVNRKKQQDKELKALSRDHELEYRKNLKQGWRNK